VVAFNALRVNGIVILASRDAEANLVGHTALP
jgi:hypothetical protein